MANTSVLQMAADLTASTATGVVSQLLPSGTVLPFAGINVPAGWLPCDGREVSQTTYAALFLAVQTTYNTQVNPTTGSAYAAPSAGNFRLPDYRGLFLRGTGTASGGDATTIGGHQSHKTAPNGIAVSNAASGVYVEGSRNQFNNSTGWWSSDHYHELNIGGVDDKNFSGSGIAGQYPPADAGYVGRNGSTTHWASHNHYHDFSYSGNFGASGTANAQTATVTGDAETRPVNKGINYIIKV